MRAKRTAAAMAVALVLAVTACGGDDDSGGGDGSSDKPGNPEVDDRIAAETDCTALQSEFDQAAANNDRAEPGTNQFDWTLGT
jgi:hypothetical protein